MGTLPPELPHGASQTVVKWTMGKPQWVSRGWQSGDGRRVDGEVWHYEDRWWTTDVIAPQWGSWDIFFTDKPRPQMAGWRMTEPPAGLEGDRAAQYAPLERSMSAE